MHNMMRCGGCVRGFGRCIAINTRTCTNQALNNGLHSDRKQIKTYIWCISKHQIPSVKSLSKIDLGLQGGGGGGTLSLRTGSSNLLQLRDLKARSGVDV
jgi:hypothetical protein